MGILGKILSGAVGDAIEKAVGEAAKKVVNPAAERLAEKQAEVIDNLAKKAEAKMDEMAAAAETEAAKVAEAAETATAAGVEAAKAGPTTEEQKQAIEALKGLGAMFSGAIAMAKKEAEAEEQKRLDAEKAVFDNWAENLGVYPVWDVGGEQFEIEEQTPMNGYPVWRLTLKGRPYLVELYTQKLRAAGFVAKGSDPLDLNADTYYKLIDDVCWSFNRTDAACDGWINVTFFVDKYVPPKPKTVPQQAQQADDIAKLAKSIFKKLF
jgi:hypothetical protein